MKKNLLIGFLSILCVSAGFVFMKAGKHIPNNTSVAIQKEEEGDEEEDENENLQDRYLQEFEQMKDPALGYVPADRLTNANEVTEGLRHMQNGRLQSLAWTERGPIYDSTGPSNGNPRGGGGFTAGIIQTFLLDTVSDPTGNTIFIGAPSGGLWKCTNLLSSNAPNWQPVNDFMSNLAISSICRDPAHPNILYIATGDANTRDVYGNGIWKSTDYGTSWNMLPAIANYRFAFKILCDNTGNLYVASGILGLLRSTNGGNSFTSISPAGLTVSNPSYVPDLEISRNGRLHACFGYYGTTAMHYYTNTPATVSSTAGWNTSTGIRTGSSVGCSRIEFATQGNTMYALTVNTSFNVDSCYKSTDDGATWTKQNTTAYTTGLGSAQSWYAITLQINPDDSSQFITGGLDAYKSTDNGATITRQTYWVSSVPYVHADHHWMQWYKQGGESRVLIGCDGGLWLSRDGGANWKDRNENLGIKQFYSCAIHPAAGSSFLFAGAQDNGCHQIKTPGKTYSYETTGGDGAYVHINQQNPLIQFGSYVYNQYRRSTDGGQTWSSVNLSTTLGFFINPFDYDDGQNIMYASNANTSAPNNQLRRWNNANIGTTSTTVTLAELTRNAIAANASCFKVSPYTTNRVFVGGSTGRLLKLDSANTVTSANESANVTDLTGTAFPSGNINCINTGSSEQYMVAVFSNYGVNNLWYTTNGGTSWTAIDGNLPDMPVWWAVFVPGHDDQMVIATESGVFTTQLINGSSTVWTANPSFPIVRTRMLKIRASDNTIVAATYGRGLFSAQLEADNTTPQINFTTATSSAQEQAYATAATSCRSYRDYIVNVANVNKISGNATVTYAVQAGSTAKQGVDFDFTTNGDFSNPSTQHLFLTDTTDVKPITIRIYDDAEVESAESFTIAYTISGTTNAVAGSVKTHVFNITDNDFAPKVNGTNNYTVGSYDINMTGNASAFAGNQLKNRLQVIYSAAELKASGIYTAAAINSLTVRVASKSSTRPFNGFTISMGRTGTTTMNTGFVPDPLTQVYTGNYSTVVGDNTFTFSTPFAWDGISNIAVQFCFDNAGATGGVNAAEDVMEGNSTPLGSLNYASCYANYTTGTTSGCSLGASFITSSRINATFGAAFGNSIASVLNTTKTEYLNNGNDLYFYSASGEILARIKNLSSSDYGCTQVIIDRAGTSAQAFWNNNPANYLLDKTYRVIPSTNNPAGQYEITLYYTNAEKTGWETATGQSWSNIQLVKVPSQIANYTPANPLPDGSSAVEMVTPVFGTFGTGYTLTYTFATGFSGFGAGIPGTSILPVSLLSFQGHLENATAVLNWSTSSEINTKDFEIQKSADGVNFYKIGAVKAAGTSSARKDYTITDNKLSETNYYRLKMNDADGKFKLSNVVNLNYRVSVQNVWVVTNPFKDNINLRFAKTGERAKLQLFSLNGALVAEKTVSNVSGQIQWQLSNSISSGSYLLKVTVDGQPFTSKLIKQ